MRISSNTARIRKGLVKASWGDGEPRRRGERSYFWDTECPSAPGAISATPFES